MLCLPSPPLVACGLVAEGPAFRFALGAGLTGILMVLLDLWTCLGFR